MQNLEGGARFLKAQLDRFERVDLALATYNAGPARVARTGGVPEIAEAQAYVRIVTERYEHLIGASS
jgi:soluble lytic murein transglycosylase-like protein